MKKIYTVLSIMLIGIQISNAQLTITKTANDAVVGDVVNMAEYDSVSVVPKSTGTSQNWNFSGLTVGSFTETTTYTTVASFSAAASYSAANIAAIRGTNNWEFWKQSTSMLEYVGQTDANSKVVFSNYGTWNNWPVAFGNSNTDAFSALETAPTYTNNWNGTISYTATGTGTVTLPGGNVHTNCLQLKKNISLVVTGSSTASMTIQQYYYYSSTSKFPIVTIEYQAQTSGTTTSMNSNILVNTAAMTVGLNEAKGATGNFIVYPNPASHEVNVFLPNNTVPTSIEVMDVTGRVVASEKNALSVNVSTLAKAVYTIRVRTKDSVLQKQIVVTE